MATRRYKRNSFRRKEKRSRTKKFRRGGQQLWRLGSLKAVSPGLRGGKWNPEYYKLGANHFSWHRPCSLTYSSIRAAANLPDHGYKIKN